MKQLSKHKRPKRWGRFALFGVACGAMFVAIALGSGAYAMGLENRDSFCASCHTEPESHYYQQSQEASAATLAAFHAQQSVHCIDCHSGDGPFGRVEGLWQGTQDSIAYYRNHYHDPAITTNPLGDASCTKCHASVLTDGGFNNHFHAFLPRWQSIDPQAARCVDCHASHPTASSDQTYLVVAQVQSVCQECHFRLGEGD
jgi:predicted CXXCH cytochrome family protein